MRLIPSSFNGFLFQQGKSVASDWNTKYDWSIGGITANSIQRSQNFPAYAAKGYSASIKVITVNFNDVDADRNSLVIAMDVLGENQHKLYATDRFGRAWYVNAVCIGLNEEEVSDNTAVFGAIFDVDDPIWKLATPSTQTMQVFYGTGGGTITPIGNQPALPIITITPSSAGSVFGFTTRRFIQAINNSPNALNMYPLNLVGDAGWDTATEVGAGAMLASGDDLRVYVDGAEVKRWIVDMNTDHTKVWINWTQPANSDLTLGADIAGSGAVSTVTIENTPLNVSVLGLVPVTGNVKIGNEIFVYTGIDALSMQLTGCTRAERQTAMEAHSIGDTVSFLTHDCWIYYGNPSIAAYVVDDTFKPIIDLAFSTNSLHAYDEFSNQTGTRTAQWQALSYGSDPITKTYTGTNNTSADPATDIGFFQSTLSINSKTMEWRLYNPCGITLLSAVGQRYTEGYWYPGSSFDPPLPYDVLGKAFFNRAWWQAGHIGQAGVAFDRVLWDDAPSSVSLPASWEAISHIDVDVTVPGLGYEPPGIGDIFYIRAFVQSSMNYRMNAMLEYSAVAITLNPSLVPTVVMTSDGAFTPVNISSVISNAATGESITIDIIMLLNTAVVIDTKEKTITLYDGTNAINALQDFPVRAEWLQLLPEVDNVITITEAGEADYVFTWEDRAL